MTIPVIVTADDAEILITLQKDGVTFNIDPTDIVEAAVVSVDHVTQLMAAVAQSNAASGADWANSLIAVNFTAAQTALISSIEDHALLEIQVTQNSKKTTWFGDVMLVKGHIA